MASEQGQCRLQESLRAPTLIIAGMTVVIGTLFIKQTKDVDIHARD